MADKLLSSKPSFHRSLGACMLVLLSSCCEPKSSCRWLISCLSKLPLHRFLGACMLVLLRAQIIVPMADKLLLSKMPLHGSLGAFMLALLRTKSPCRWLIGCFSHSCLCTALSIRASPSVREPSHHAQPLMSRFPRSCLHIARLQRAYARPCASQIAVLTADKLLPSKLPLPSAHRA